MALQETVEHCRACADRPPPPDRIFGPPMGDSLDGDVMEDDSTGDDDDSMWEDGDSMMEDTSEEMSSEMDDDNESEETEEGMFSTLVYTCSSK